MTQNQHFAAGEVVLGAKGMCLEDTLVCGQTFSWQRSPENVFLGVAGKKVITARQENDNIYIASRTEEALSAEDIAYWAHYFALDSDYAAIQKALCKNPMLKKCVDFAPGIRVLNQPFYDTLLSFIASQRNQIPNIFGIVSRLREMFGSKLAPGVFSFPDAGKLAALSTEDLEPIRSGYRAKYLIDAAQKVVSGEIDEKKMREMSTENAYKQLLKINGVGEKVANCVLLFGLEKYDTAPVDIWIKRVLEEYFPDGWPKEALGYEGIAQQYMFFWGRKNKIGTEQKTL